MPGDSTIDAPESTWADRLRARALDRPRQHDKASLLAEFRAHSEFYRQRIGNIRTWEDIAPLEKPDIRHVPGQALQLFLVIPVTRNQKREFPVSAENRDQVLQPLDLFEAADKEKIRLPGRLRPLSFRAGKIWIGLGQKVRDVPDGDVQPQLMMLVLGESAGRDKTIHMPQHAPEPAGIPPELGRPL